MEYAKKEQNAERSLKEDGNLSDGQGELSSNRKEAQETEDILEGFTPLPDKGLRNDNSKDLFESKIESTGEKKVEQGESSQKEHLDPSPKPNSQYNNFESSGEFPAFQESRKSPQIATIEPEGSNKDHCDNIDKEFLTVDNEFDNNLLKNRDNANSGDKKHTNNFIYKATSHTNPFAIPNSGNQQGYTMHEPNSNQQNFMFPQQNPWEIQGPPNLFQPHSYIGFNPYYNPYMPQMNNMPFNPYAGYQMHQSNMQQSPTNANQNPQLLQEVMQMKIALTNLESENAALKEKLAELGSGSPIQQAREQVKQEPAKKDNEMRHKITTIADEKEMRMTERALADKHEELINELENVSSEKRKKEEIVKKLNNEVETVRNFCDNLKRENDKLKNSLTKSDQEIFTTTEQLSQKERENEILSRKLKVQEQNFKNLREDFDNLVIKHHDFKKKNESLLNTHENTKEENFMLKTEVDKLNKKLTNNYLVQEHYRELSKERDRKVRNYLMQDRTREDEENE